MATVFGFLYMGCTRWQRLTRVVTEKGRKTVVVWWWWYIWGAHWRHLANTTELSMCGGDAALCQITFTTGYHLSLLLHLLNSDKENF